MRQQRREFGLNRSVMLVVRTDQNPMPIPAAGLRWLNQQQHLTLEEVHGKPTEHALGEKSRVLNKRFDNPLVFKLLHVFPAEQKTLIPPALKRDRLEVRFEDTAVFLVLNNRSQLDCG